ncbi:Exostosin family protein [Raphanus sativus]|uniref:Probable glycosyltransferase At3g07620 n=1 Tax=Raphanus sativus TaxID=3726 RepID=A0A6J0LKA4_RAPSA|nr:probable glycosyltransferase At3g07620 [Raphanus sativus]XP_018460129.1 probable glycosyltransferase At3g07620 [Raphanus sativus]XP_018460130.1 probable glycosyltransferase At3g07620 [Raphanus sativus]KAJ4900586.1 Exostosin family protein [Raphanus sativus]
MRPEFPGLWKVVESRRLLWLVGLTFALIVTFQYIELPNTISSLFSSTKFPSSRNSTSLTRDSQHQSHSSNLSPAMPPSFPQKNATLVDDSGGGDGDEEVEVDKIFDTSGNATAPANATSHVASAEPPAALPLVKVEATAPTVSPSHVKENATAPVASANPPAALPLVKVNATAPTVSPSEVKENATAPAASAEPPAALPALNRSPVKENATTSQVEEDKKSTKTDAGSVSPVVRFVPDVKENSKMPDSGVMSISEMSKQLRRNRISHNRLAKKPKWVTKPDLELLQAKHEIENAPIDEKDPLLYAPLYRNVSIFKRSYELMEKMLKVYVYKEGDKPIMHSPILRGIYASEGWFMKLIESNNNKFVTKDASKAHLFYLPFSSRMLEVTLYVQDSHSHRNLIQYLKDYIDFISVKYPFWNRTSGADHFLAACHDWAPSETRKHFAKSIRALCNSDVKEGFVFGKDTSLPETFVRDPKKPLSNIGGKSASQRPTLAFFAGKPDHGYLRPILLSYWGNDKDPDLKIFGKLPRTKGNKNYLQFMKTSKYCICAKGFEVNSPRVVEAIFYDCVPVIISDNFVPPFFEVLNWESFALFVAERDIPNLKKILMSVSERRYRQMQMRVKRVQKHFLWHVKPEKYDMFHMILHSVWFNRVFQISV